MGARRGRATAQAADVLAAALHLDLDRLLGYAGYLANSPTLSRAELLKSFYDLIPELPEEDLFVAVECAWGELRRRFATGKTPTVD